ncbi:hypothetical protein CEXT_271621 [Caerostris extrusa]|uniref:Uncharacterized protein n=1 Tax=Caerostris extrusa TaxID=172846 RepID=A0AAV4UW26_CAEEX|nr:hypothetical protein CEXT_271621 [Caerostris extrusa]
MINSSNFIFGHLINFKSKQQFKYNSVFESYQVVKPKNSAHAFVRIPLKTELRAVRGIIHRPGNSLNNRSLGSPPEQPNRTEKNRTRFYLYKARKSFFKILEA